MPPPASRRAPQRNATIKTRRVVSDPAFPARLQHSQNLPDFLSNLFRRRKRHIFVERKKSRRRNRLGNKFVLFATFCLLVSFSMTTLLVTANTRQARYQVLWQEQTSLGHLEALADLNKAHPDAATLDLQRPWVYQAFYIPSFRSDAQLLLTDSEQVQKLQQGLQQGLLLDSSLLPLAMKETWRLHILITALLAFTTLVALVLWFRLVFVVPLEDTVHAIHRFTNDPGNLMTMLIASGRDDEIGFLQRELTRMQVVYRISLKQYQHLATLGGAVTKINHDLKGLLSTALIAGESLHKVKDPKIRRKIKLFETALERAIALCEQLLGYVSEDKKPTFLTRVNLENLIQSLGAELQLHAKDKTTVKVETSPTLPIQGEANDIYRALRNLGQNAIEAEAQSLRITLKGDKNNVHIDIVDDGPGLSEQARQSLFKAFAPSSKVGGSGLGLSISQEIITQHNGSLTLLQSSPQGTTFHCIFPIALGTRRKPKKGKDA